MRIYHFTEAQKQIRRERALMWIKSHPDRAKQNQRKYYAEHREEIKAKCAEYGRAHRAENRDRLKAWRKKYPWYSSWQCAKQRCTNPKSTGYSYYGGRGIKFFLSIEDMKFMWERDLAYDILCPSIDRIDCDGNYELSNCRFVSMSENSSKRAFDNWRRRQKV